MAKHTNTTCRLLSTTIATKHCDTFKFLMYSYWAYYMTIITAKTSTTTSISVPFKWKLHVFTGSFSRQLCISFYLWNFKILIKEFKPHIANLNSIKAIMTICIYSLTGKIYSCFWYFVCTNASNFKWQTSQLN